MLQLLKGLDFERYEPRTYIISEGDQLSATKAAELEQESDFLPVCTVSLVSEISDHKPRTIHSLRFPALGKSYSQCTLFPLLRSNRFAHVFWRFASDHSRQGCHLPTYSYSMDPVPASPSLAQSS
jgi:hypothetical protein